MPKIKRVIRSCEIYDNRADIPKRNKKDGREKLPTANIKLFDKCEEHKLQTKNTTSIP